MAQIATLAKSYDPGRHNVRGWMFSEKLDGVRAVWLPERRRFVTRGGGSTINVPPSFINSMSHIDMVLDGELWGGRGNFQKACGIVRRHHPSEQDFEKHEIKFAAFDQIVDGVSWTERFGEVIATLDDHGDDRIFALDHHEITCMDKLNRVLDAVCRVGGEGLMARNPEAYYERTRTENLLKIKPTIDGVAEVIGVAAGGGKHTGRMGALVVREIVDASQTPELTGPIEFKVGTGFSDAEREQDWPVGTKIRWAGMGRFKGGTVREPRFVCTWDND